MPLPVIYEDERLEAAKTASSCQEWHKYCGAECCKQFTIQVKDSKRRYRRGETARFILPNLTDSLKWYYELHGARVDGNVLTVRLVNFIQKGDVITVSRRCDKLSDDLLCTGYPTNRPIECQDFTLDTARGSMKKSLTKNCLYKYQLALEENGV